MRLTKMEDGRTLFEYGSSTVLPLSAFELAQLADLVAGDAEADRLRQLLNVHGRTIRDLRLDVETRDLRIKELEEANARLDTELAKYKARVTLGGPQRPADQTWKNADLEPPASAAEDAAPPLYRGLIVDKEAE